MLTFDEEPNNFNEAKLNKDWIKSMKAKIDSIEKNNTQKLVPPPKDATPIRLRWVYKSKRNMSG